MKNAHEFPGLYDDLFDFTKAGYVMIDTEMPFVQYPLALKKYEYTSPDPDKFWMKGLLTSWHVTARGPLDPGAAHRDQRRAAVEGPWRQEAPAEINSPFIS